MNMKGKTKQEKAITLIALIITIVVLLILAVVAITAIEETDIIGQAESATGTYNNAVQNEQTILQGYVDYLNNQNGNGNNYNNPPKYKVGDTVEYDSNNDGEKEDWIVLTSEPGLLEIVSATAMGSLTLGKGDTSVKVTTDLDGDGTVGNDVDIAIASYNNAITTINNYCKSLVTATDNGGVRSVGASIEEDTSGDYSFADFNQRYGTNFTIKAKAGDEYYKTDLDKMTELGIAKADKEYWLSSRYPKWDARNVFFYLRRIDGDGNLLHKGYLWYTSTPDGVWSGLGDTLSVRPVVINPSGI